MSRPLDEAPHRKPILLWDQCPHDPELSCWVIGELEVNAWDNELSVIDQRGSHRRVRDPYTGWVITHWEELPPAP